MYKLSIIAALLMAASAVFACDTACSPAGNERNGRCYYQCTEGACHMSAGHHHDQFLSGLASRGYDCQSEGVSTLSCVKTPAFGSCWDHKWTCGQGC